MFDTATQNKDDHLRSLTSPQDGHTIGELLGKITPVQAHRLLQDIRRGQPDKNLIRLNSPYLCEIERYIKQQMGLDSAVVHLLLGPFGSGKTTLAKIVETIAVENQALCTFKTAVHTARSPIEGLHLWSWGNRHWIHQSLVTIAASTPDNRVTPALQRFIDHCQDNPAGEVLGGIARHAASKQPDDPRLADVASEYWNALTAWGGTPSRMTPLKGLLGKVTRQPESTLMIPRYGREMAHRLFQIHLHFYRAVGLYPFWIIDEFEAFKALYSSAKNDVSDHIRDMVDLISEPTFVDESANSKRFNDSQAGGLLLSTTENGMEMIRQYPALNDRMANEPSDRFSATDPTWHTEDHQPVTWNATVVAQYLIGLLGKSADVSEHAGASYRTLHTYFDDEHFQRIVAAMLNETALAPRLRLKNLLLAYLDRADAGAESFAKLTQTYSDLYKQDSEGRDPRTLEPVTPQSTHSQRPFEADQNPPINTEVQGHGSTQPSFANTSGDLLMPNESSALTPDVQASNDESDAVIDFPVFSRADGKHSLHAPMDGLPKESRYKPIIRELTRSLATKMTVGYVMDRNDSDQVEGASQLPALDRLRFTIARLMSVIPALTSPSQAMQQKEPNNLTRPLVLEPVLTGATSQPFTTKMLDRIEAGRKPPKYFAYMLARRISVTADKGGDPELLMKAMQSFSALPLEPAILGENQLLTHKVSEMLLATPANSKHVQLVFEPAHLDLGDPMKHSWLTLSPEGWIQDERYASDFHSADTVNIVGLDTLLSSLWPEIIDDENLSDQVSEPVDDTEFPPEPSGLANIVLSAIENNDRLFAKLKAEIAAKTESWDKRDQPDTAMVELLCRLAINDALPLALSASAHACRLPETQLKTVGLLAKNLSRKSSTQISVPTTCEQSLPDTLSELRQAVYQTAFHLGFAPEPFSVDQFCAAQLKALSNMKTVSPSRDGIGWLVKGAVLSGKKTKQTNVLNTVLTTWPSEEFDL